MYYSNEFRPYNHKRKKPQQRTKDKGKARRKSRGSQVTVGNQHCQKKQELPEEEDSTKVERVWEEESRKSGNMWLRGTESMVRSG